MALQTYNVEYIEIVKKGVKTAHSSCGRMGVSSIPKIVKEKTRFISDVRR